MGVAFKEKNLVLKRGFFFPLRAGPLPFPPVRREVFISKSELFSLKVYASVKLSKYFVLLHYLVVLLSKINKVFMVYCEENSYLRMACSMSRGF